MLLLFPHTSGAAAETTDADEDAAVSGETSAAEADEEAAARDFPLELLKNQLYYVARSDSEDPVVLAVRRSADLANGETDVQTIRMSHASTLA